MASEYNDPDPDPVNEGEEEIIDTGFDAILFWDQYRQVILLVAGIVILGGVGFAIFEYSHTQRIQAAGAALAQAKTEDDYRQVMDKYDGTVAAGDAAFFLAQKLRDEKKYDDATQVLQTFIDKYPKHPLVAAGDLSIAETLEVAGRKDEAIAKYEEVAAKYPDSYSAPIAVIAQANLLRQQGKTEEARRLFENFSSQFPESIFAQEAMTEMRLMRPANGPAAAATPANGLQSLMNAAPTPSPAPATPAPAASVAPVLPSVPAGSPH